MLPVGDPLPEPVRSALLRAQARGARLVTICSGMFALACPGLLNGRSATTHWARAEQLQREFPRVHVKPKRLYMDHGDVATSAGAGLELCLHLVGGTVEPLTPLYLHGTWCFRPIARAAGCSMRRHRQGTRSTTCSYGPTSAWGHPYRWTN
ncbi:DJ-1/PfpI family protein [Streptomyces sp. NPDC054861]